MTGAAVKSIVAAAAGAAIYVGLLIMITAIHDAPMPEGDTAFWACRLQGNGLCGEGAAYFTFDITKLFQGWDIVIAWWKDQLTR